LENGADGVADLLLVNVVREVRRVPDHYVLVEGALPGDEAVDADGSV